MEKEIWQKKEFFQNSFSNKCLENWTLVSPSSYVTMAKNADQRQKFPIEPGWERKEPSTKQPRVWSEKNCTSINHQSSPVLIQLPYITGFVSKFGARGKYSPKIVNDFLSDSTSYNTPDQVTFLHCFSINYKADDIA